MKFLFDLFPVILFFVAFKLQGIYVATAVAIAASFGQIGWLWLRRRKIDTMLWVSLVIIVVFGSATLLLHDETFIKWKPTVLYALFGAILAGGRAFFGRNLLAHLMPGIVLPDPVWSRLTWSWVAFFAFMGVANWYVAFHYPTETWVNFKVWGGIGLFLLFALAQGMLLARHVEEKAS